MTSGGKFFALQPADRRLAAEAAARLLLAWLGLRVLPFARLVGALDGAGGDAAIPPDAIRKIRWAVEAAARHIPVVSLTCLPQALAACWMLKARGAAPRLHYGVASTAGGGFEAHAWVELHGTPVIGHRSAGRFTLLTTFPPSEATAA